MLHKEEDFILRNATVPTRERITVQEVGFSQRNIVDCLLFLSDEILFAASITIHNANTLCTQLHHHTNVAWYTHWSSSPHYWRLIQQMQWPWPATQIGGSQEKSSAAHCDYIGNGAWLLECSSPAGSSATTAFIFVRSSRLVFHETNRNGSHNGSGAVHCNCTGNGLQLQQLRMQVTDRIGWCT